MKTLLIATAALMIVSAAPMQAGDVKAGDVKAGVDAWAKGDYKAAVDKWRGPAVAGDADAQFNLGQAYKLGRGVPTDLAMAEEWYRKAATNGHRQAADNYGLALFQNGKRDQAVEWLEKSSARGEPRAQFVLGTMLFNGDVVKKDWVRAYALMVRANAAGLPQAAQTLAQMDKYVGVQERQQGLTLARRLETEAGRPQLAAADAPTATPAAAPSRGTIARTELPPSRVAEVPAPPPATTPAPVAAAPTRTATTVAAPAPAPAPARTAAPVAAPAPARTDGGWRVQLGAFRADDGAQTLWRRVSGNAGLAGTSPEYVKAGAVTRLLAGPFASNAEAGRACAALKRAGQACLPVRK
ncbi:SPOR domain-containing protein [Sphingomonas baiyangensis]|uniref:SPOR domain-containing protein n=1 Tax=Sphingomonas baiyangensis TaxID=2572576 RepID=A0A4U1L0D9_9SPHN|nr:SPOR domain-containing protein [Sphingomonas baiyangensis]TKD50072.1 hypothetical protein FBR43_04350 [Sphingomonas baiyangensis]